MIALLVVLGIIALAVVAPRVVAALFGLALLGIMIIGAVIYHETEEGKRNAIAAKTLGRSAPIELTNLGLDLAGFKQLTGRLVNHSPDLTVTAVELRLRVWEAGTVIGDAVTTIRVTVPPQQARAISGWPSFQDLGKERAPNTWTWTYDVLSISAQP